MMVGESRTARGQDTTDSNVFLSISVALEDIEDLIILGDAKNDTHNCDDLK